MAFGTSVLRKGLDEEVYFCRLPETLGSPTCQDAPSGQETRTAGRRGCRAGVALRGSGAKSLGDKVGERGRERLLED